MRKLNRRQVLRLAGSAVAAAITGGYAQGVRAASADSAGPVLLLQTRHPQGPVSQFLTGVNNDQWFDDSQRLRDPSANAPNPDAVTKTRRAGIRLVRYPGGTPASLFNWKAAIGPQSQRGCQIRGNPSPVDGVYGSDEHMRFCAAVGAQAQIHVPFVVNTPRDAADWVGLHERSDRDGVGRPARRQRPPRALRRALLGDRQRAGPGR